MGDSEPHVPPLRATFFARLRRRPARLTYHLAHVRWHEGKPLVVPVTSASSGDVLSLERARAFIVAPGDSQAILAGAEFDALTWA